MPTGSCCCTRPARSKFPVEPKEEAIPKLSYSPKSVKGDKKGGIIGVTKGDTRSFDYGTVEDVILA